MERCLTFFLSIPRECRSFHLPSTITISQSIWTSFVFPSTNSLASTLIHDEASTILHSYTCICSSDSCSAGSTGEASFSVNVLGRQYTPPGNLTTSVEAALTDGYNLSYSSPAQIGDTNMSLIFDTGSNDLWVLSDQLSAREFAGHAVYKTEESGTGNWYTGRGSR